MKDWFVEVTCRTDVPKEQWDSEDQATNPVGIYTFWPQANSAAVAKEAALDQFHQTVPIALLETFEITAEIKIWPPGSEQAEAHDFKLRLDGPVFRRQREMLQRMLWQLWNKGSCEVQPDAEPLIAGLVNLTDAIADQAIDGFGIDCEIRDEPDRLEENESERCECEQPGYYYSGVPGIIARVVKGKLAPGDVPEKCELCDRYPYDADAAVKLAELGIMPPEWVLMAPAMLEIMKRLAECIEATYPHDKLGNREDGDSPISGADFLEMVLRYEDEVFKALARAGCDIRKGSPNQAQITVKVVVACTAQPPGVPDFFATVVECFKDEYQDGQHYAIAKERARDESYEGPFVAFDEYDGPAWLFKTLFNDGEQVP